jgi:hypothetical protein
MNEVNNEEKYEFYLVLVFVTDVCTNSMLILAAISINNNNNNNNNSLALVRERTIPTKRPQLVSEVSANF